ncbi:hypothetical protein [Rhizobacter sp. LjRoot28]|uniref:hypothetical protein n=1 Tax=Rhizobacter sp. LjRoot28 TaxID=3342309 RepID=UPI003ECF7348
MSMLLLASVLIFLTGLAHSYLGERYILIRLFKRTTLPKLFGDTAFTVGTLRFAWHLTTLVWWSVAAMLFVADRGTLSEEHVLTIIGTTSLLSASLPLWFTRGKHLSWLVFLVVGALALLARGGS